MIKQIRKKIAQANRIVIKVGTNVLTDDNGALSKKNIRSLITQISYAKKQMNKEIVLVSSGAIGAGMGELEIAERPKTLPELQALASVGQGRLIQIYHDLFKKKGIRIGQVLLTLEDMRDRKRHLNTSNTLMTLLRMGVVPVINENDTVAVDEIKFGDNDMLAAMASILIRADLLIILTNVDGFYDMENNIIFEHVIQIDGDIKKHIRLDKTRLGIGGMSSKLKAVEKILAVGEIAVIANGQKKDTLLKVLKGKKTGTVFYEDSIKMTGKKRWIAFFPDAEGRVCIDNGAVRALKEKKSSLLPAGIVQVEGNFKAGSIISILDKDKHEIGRGLVNYSAGDISKIQGCQSIVIKDILGSNDYDEVIHRDNLVIFK